jgi:glycosyltransferase involved in cell wall biosynthesis
MSNKKKARKPSLFQQRLQETARKNALDKLSPEAKKERSLQRLEETFFKLGNKENTYLFYCPDMPFGTTSVKTIYEFAYKLQKLGFKTKVLHEQYGFKPNWFKDEWVKEVKVDYIQGKPSAKSNKRPEANYRFQPTDTIILPEGFWTLAEGFKDIKPLSKVILALGYGGLMTAEPGLDWSHFGFTDVICLTERLKQDYQAVWPHFRYHVVPYSINTESFTPVPVDKVYPAIGLSVRNREDAQAIINIFYNRYPYLDIFEFKVLKRLDTKTYADTLKHCACLVFIDEKAGCPAPPLEAIASGLPTIAVYGRGMEHLSLHPSIQWLENNDFFVIAEALATFCIKWLQDPTVQVTDKEILDNYTNEKVDVALTTTFNELQQNKIQTFTAIKTAIDNNRLTYEEQDLEPEEIEEVTTESEEPAKEPGDTELKIVK